jgi:aspartate aminotransferase
MRCEQLASDAVRPSATLATDELIRQRLAAGRQVLHLGFGEAGLPVHPSLREVLADAASINGYGPVAGSPEVRGSAAGYFDRRRLPTDPDLVVTGPGSKSLLFALIAALAGDVVLPAPSWVTYAAQSALLGRRVIRVPVSPGTGGVPDPAQLTTALERANADRLEPRILIVTVPDNPTGLMATETQLRQVCQIAEEHDLVIISDEIYRDLAYDQDRFLSPAELAPGRTVITSGLSKNLALGGWRTGFARLPDSPLGRRLLPDVLGVASEIWSCLARPMQAVAAYALTEPAELVGHVGRSRALHRAVALAAHRVFVDAGAKCHQPQAAFYLYPDLEAWRPRLERSGIETGGELAAFLLDRLDVAVLAGEAFGDDVGAMRFRAATSLLYGDTDEERWQALDSADPAALPWVARKLDALRAALEKLSTSA